MSLSASLIDAMVATGCTVEQMAAVVKAALAEEETQKACKKAQAAERQRKCRAGKRMSRSVTVTSCDTPDKESFPHTPFKEINPLPPVSPKGDTTPHDISEVSAEPENQPVPSIKPEHVVEAWNEMAGRVGLAKVSKLTDQRLRHIRNRIRQNSVDEIAEALAAVERSSFLRGENSTGWKADFDFFIQLKSFTKLLEGSYDGNN